MENKNIVFFGTPKFAACILQGLIENHYHIIAVVTQPDKPVGRKKLVLKTPVKEIAEQYHLPVYQPILLRKDFEFLKQMDIDMIITAAYGQILPNEVLSLAKVNCINVHGSLLPKYRGGAPIQRAIMNGEKTTGITIMKMVDKMDAGEMYAKEEIAILENENSSELFDRLMIVGKNLLLKVLPSLFDQSLKGELQNEADVTFAYNIKREEEKIDFNQNVEIIFNQIRGLANTPGAYCFYGQKQLKIFKAQIYNHHLDDNEIGTLIIVEKNKLLVRCANGYLLIQELQMEGKAKMNAMDFLNGVQKAEFLKNKLL